MNPVLAMIIGIIVMMFLIIKTRLHPFPAMIISAILIAILSGNALLVGTGNEGKGLLAVAVSTVTAGFGGTMTSIGIVIGLGCIMGIFLEKSGAARACPHRFKFQLCIRIRKLLPQQRLLKFIFPFCAAPNLPLPLGEVPPKEAERVF